MHVSVEDDDVQVFRVLRDELVGILSLRHAAHSRTGENRVVKCDKHSFGPRGLGLIQPLAELVHLLFVGGAGRQPTGRSFFLVTAGPKEDKTNSVVIELIDESLVRYSELLQIGEGS